MSGMFAPSGLSVVDERSLPWRLVVGLWAPLCINLFSRILGLRRDRFADCNGNDVAALIDAIQKLNFFEPSPAQLSRCRDPSKHGHVLTHQAIHVDLTRADFYFSRLDMKEKGRKGDDKFSESK